MGFKATVLADSISPDGVRLTTQEVTFPRIVLAEFNTHRVFTRNSSSSRAIPVEKMWRRVWDDPFFPVHWGKNQSGMSAREELSGWRLSLAMKLWWLFSRVAVLMAMLLLKVGVHKQITNRL